MVKPHNHPPTPTVNPISKQLWRDNAHPAEPTATTATQQRLTEISAKLDFNWRAAQNDAFELLKTAVQRPPSYRYRTSVKARHCVSSMPTLRSYSRRFATKKDAIAANVIAYVSSRLPKTLRHMSATTCKLYAIYAFVRQFQQYLQYWRLVIRTDHRALDGIRLANYKITFPISVGMSTTDPGRVVICGIPESPTERPKTRVLHNI